MWMDLTNIEKFKILDKIWIYKLHFSSLIFHNIFSYFKNKISLTAQK